MSYGTVVKDLARILGKQILAYDNLPDRGGCLLYVSGPIKRIDIEVRALDEGASDLAAFVRQTIASPPENVQCVGIGMRDGAFALFTDEAAETDKNQLASAGA